MDGFECKPYKLACIVLLLLALFTADADADEPDMPTFSFSGFGTVGVVHSSEDQADFSSSIEKPNGAGYSHNWSPNVDSLVGVQGTAKLSPRLTAVLQVISEQNYDNSYRPHVEWVNIKYQATPNFSVRGGRTVLPTFLFSGTRKVAYTFPWVRPPLEVYARVPVTASDGVDIRYRTHVADFTHTVQANYGSSEQSLPRDGGTVKADQAWGLTYTVGYHDATMHLAYQRPQQLTITSTQTLFDAFRQFGAQGIALANQYDADKKPLSIVSVGAMCDPGMWFVMAEWARTESHSFLGKGTGWYVSSGYRFGKLTPYLTYARATADNLSDPGLNLSILPPPMVGPATGLNAALNGLLSQKVVQNTLSIGARWEVMRNAAVKLQYDHTDIGAGSRGVLTNLQPGFQTGGKINVVSATIDFVF